MPCERTFFAYRWRICYSKVFYISWYVTSIFNLICILFSIFKHYTLCHECFVSCFIIQMLNCVIILPAIHFKWLRIVLFKKKKQEPPPPKKNPTRINTCLWTALVFHLILHVNVCPLSELSSFVTNEWNISSEKYFCAVDFVKTQQRLYAFWVG